jgi:type I restriction enzyme S subunit
MSSDVTQLTLAEICSDVSYGHTESATIEPVGPKFLRITDIQGGTFDWGKVPFCPASEQDTKKYRLEVGDIVVARTGNSTGENAQVFLPPPPAVFASYLIRFRPDPRRVNPFFVGYQLRSERFRQHVLSVRSGSAQPGANAKQLGAFPVQLLDRTQQDATVDTLRALDDRITLLRETNATLEAIAQALFKSWFVDFDPVRAKMEGRAPEGMDEATAALFPDGLETLELGEVPRGWRVGQVADLGDVVCGKTPPTSAPENYGCDVPFITIPDMHDLLAVTTTARSLSKLGADSQPKKYLPPGAICVSCIATPGLVVRVTTTAQTNQQINSVIPQKKWGSSFPLFLLRRIGGAVRSGGSGGSVFHNLSKSGFEQLPVLLAEPELADRFNAAIDPLVEKIVSNQLQTQTLSTLRDTLLPRLISGQLRLTETLNHEPKPAI